MSTDQIIKMSFSNVFGAYLKSLGIPELAWSVWYFAVILCTADTNNSQQVHRHFDTVNCNLQGAESCVLFSRFLLLDCLT